MRRWLPAVQARGEISGPEIYDQEDISRLPVYVSVRPGAPIAVHLYACLAHVSHANKSPPPPPTRRTPRSPPNGGPTRKLRIGFCYLFGSINLCRPFGNAHPARRFICQTDKPSDPTTTTTTYYTYILCIECRRVPHAEREINAIWQETAVLRYRSPRGIHNSIITRAATRIKDTIILYSIRFAGY